MLSDERTGSLLMKKIVLTEKTGSRVPMGRGKRLEWLDGVEIERELLVGWEGRGPSESDGIRWV